MPTKNILKIITVTAFSVLLLKPVFGDSISKKTELKTTQALSIDEEISIKDLSKFTYDFMDSLTTSQIEDYVKLLEEETALSDDELDALSEKNYSIFEKQEKIITNLKLAASHNIKQEEDKKQIKNKKILEEKGKVIEEKDKAIEEILKTLKKRIEGKLEK